MNKIILASRSPRRSELLDMCGIEYEVDPSDIQEMMDPSLEISKRIEKLAYDKTIPTFNRHQDQIVVGADTVVYIDGEVIGKAKNLEHAREILRKLSGRVHQVITGVCIMKEGFVETFSSSSDVLFYDLSDDEIQEYLDINEWQGKAGAYAIQGAGCRFVKEIHGDFANIVGLPVAKLLRELKKIKSN